MLAQQTDKRPAQNLERKQQTVSDHIVVLCDGESTF